MGIGKTASSMGGAGNSGTIIVILGVGKMGCMMGMASCGIESKVSIMLGILKMGKKMGLGC